MINIQDNKWAKDFIHSVLQRTDLSKPVIDIFILDRGDVSRYHEIIVLQYRKSEWHLTEDYLTPEYSFRRKSRIENMQPDTVHIWLEQLVLKNEDVFLSDTRCPQEGLLLP